MKNWLYLPLSILLLLSFSDCTHKIAVDKMPTQQLIFGSGGGFTGAVTQYVLLDDGRLAQLVDAKKGYKVLTKIKSDDLTKIKSDVTTLSKFSFNEPSNLYYFIETKDFSNKNQRLTWGDSGKAVPTEVEAVYKNLIAFIPKK